MRLVGPGTFALCSLFLLLMASLAWSEAHGFLSDDVTHLWAETILQIDGPAEFMSTDAFYPPVPFTMSLLLYAVVGDLGVPMPFVISAGLGAVLLVLWFRNLSQRGAFSTAASLAAVALLGVNPLFLRAVADGPGTVLTILGIWIFTRGLVNLRLTGNAPDMMKVAVGTILVALSDGFGLLLCLGALPFMIVAARPSMIAASSTGYLVAMFYPIAAAVGSLLFTSMIFDSVLVPNLFEPATPLDLSQHLWVLAGLLPMTVIAVLRNVMLPRVFMPLLAALGTVCGAYGLNLFYQLESDPAMAIAPLLGVAVTAVRYWPLLPLRTAILLTLLAASFFLSALSLRESGTPETRRWLQAMRGENTDNYDHTLQTAIFLREKSGIMLDVERNPHIVVALGGLERLLVAGQREYDWAMQGGMPTAPYVLVPTAPEGAQTTDRVLRRFPQIKAGRLAGYEELHANAQWRVFGRTDGMRHAP